MVITLEQFKEEIDRNWTEYIRTQYQRSPEEYTQVARVKQTTRFFDKIGGVQGIQGPILNRDIEAIPFFNPIKDYTTYIKQQFYRGGYTVTRDIMEMGEYQTAIDNLSDCGASEKTLRDQTVVNVLNNGFVVQGYEPIEADGVRRSLFSTAHVREDNGGTISNYYQASVPPNLDTVYYVGINMLQRLVDNVGNFIGGYGKLTIVVPTLRSDWCKAAELCVKSVEDPFTANRSVNTARTRFSLEVCELNQLTSTDYWFIRVELTIPSYPIRLQNFRDYSMTPLQPMANNPDAMFSRGRSVFGVGLGSTFRGICAVGP